MLLKNNKNQKVIFLDESGFIVGIGLDIIMIFKDNLF